MSPKSNSAPVVAVLNMKGGVGKTTISAHVMHEMFRQKRASTLLVDLDPQFNLSQAVLTRSQYDGLRNEDKTILSAMESPSTRGLHDIKITTQAPPNPTNLAHQLRYFTLRPKLPSTRKRKVRLDLIAGDFRLVKYSMIDNKPKLDSVQNRFLQFINTARKEYDFVCIDCNPSSSFITSCALHACNHLLVPVRPDRYSILGLEILQELINLLPSVNPNPELHVLLNGVPRTKYDPSVEDELRGHKIFGKKVLARRMYNSSLLRASMNYTGFATDKPVPHRFTLKREIVAIVNELSTRLGVR